MQSMVHTARTYDAISHDKPFGILHAYVGLLSEVCAQCPIWL